MHGKYIPPFSILHDYWQSHGPLPLSRVQGQGTTLYSFLCGNPAISFTGTKASEIYIAVKSSKCLDMVIIIILRDLSSSKSFAKYV